MKNIKGTALVYSGGLLDDLHAKTAHGFCVFQIDSRY
ncbi:MAG: hypothetical protein Ct9H300mP6_15950 [Gammaproteobacteria bacterium]|nr:MAG: hypothetical protein Ct9H300mP6_15950 [Gammaproteobacteria bacterium]